MSIFEKILNTKIEDTPPVPLPPVGTYVFQVTESPKENVRGNYTFVSFQCQGVSVLGESVDPEELVKFGGAKNVRLRKEFLFPNEGTPDYDETKIIETQNQLKRFVREHLGITASEAPAFKEAFAISRGRYFGGEVTHRQDKNDTSVFYGQLGKTMPAED